MWHLSLLIAVGATGLASFTDAKLVNLDVVVHLLEWSWADVAYECEKVLGPKGYAAVQVSPPQEDVRGDQWWTRYQPVSYNLTSRSGSEQEFSAMVARCNAAGVAVYVDVVLNHMANVNQWVTGRGGSPAGPRSFPGLYDPCTDFHHNPDNCDSNCQMNNDQDLYNIQYCDLGLPDLATGNQHVQQQLSAYLRHLLDLGVTGFRVDAAKHIPAEDLHAILAAAGGERAKGDLPDTYQEIVTHLWSSTAAQLQWWYQNGRVQEFKASNLLSTAFKYRQLGLLVNGLGSYSTQPWADSQHAAVFVANHDELLNANQRVDAVTFLDGPLYALAITFLLAHPYGQPLVLSSLNFSPDMLDPQGNYQGAPVDSQTGALVPVYSKDGSSSQCGQSTPYLCEHRWGCIAAMVHFRRAVGDAAVDVQVLNDGKAVAVRRHGSGFVVLNTAYPGGGQQMQGVQVDTGLPAGAYWDTWGGCQTQVIVDNSGRATVDVPYMSALALQVQSPQCGQMQTGEAFQM